MNTHPIPGIDVAKRRGPSMFLVAGGLFVVFAGLWGAFAFTAMDSEAAQDVVGPAGWALAFLGLLALSCRVGEESRRLALVSGGLAGLGLVGAVCTALGNLAVLGALVDSLPEWFAVLQLPLLLGIVLGFGTVSASTVHTDVTSRSTSVLLLVPAVVFLLNIVRVATLGALEPKWAPFVLGAGQALALLAIGYTLRSDGGVTGRHDPTSGATTE